MSRPMANSDFRTLPDRRPIGPVAEIVEELKAIEAEAKEADKALDKILR